MAVTPVSSTVVPATTPSPLVVANRKPNSSESFSDLISNVLQEANLDQQRADAALHGLATGQVDNIHSVVLSVAKADLSFRFLLELRNRLTEAYQEISRMQF